MRLILLLILLLVSGGCRTLTIDKIVIRTGLLFPGVDIYLDVEEDIEADIEALTRHD